MRTGNVNFYDELRKLSIYDGRKKKDLSRAVGKSTFLHRFVNLMA